MSYTLTPADVALLRASLKRPGPSDGTFGQGIPPHIIYRPPQGGQPPAWALHAYGRLEALSASPEPLLAALEREATEPGFIARLVSSALDPEATLLPTSTLTARMAAAVREAEARERARINGDDAAWRKRRAQLLDPAHISLDDLD